MHSVTLNESKHKICDHNLFQRSLKFAQRHKLFSKQFKHIPGSFSVFGSFSWTFKYADQSSLKSTTFSYANEGLSYWMNFIDNITVWCVITCSTEILLLTEYETRNSFLPLHSWHLFIEPSSCCCHMSQSSLASRNDWDCDFKISSIESLHIL